MLRSVTIGEKTFNLTFKSVNVDSEDLLERMVRFLRDRQDRGEFIGFDVETTSTRPETARLVGLSFCGSRDGGFYVPVGHDFGRQLPLEAVLEAVSPIVTGRGVVAHGSKYDVRVMRRYGIEVAIALDSLSVVRLLGEVEHGVGLKPTIERFYGEEVIEFSDVVPKRGMTFAEAEIGSSVDYAVQDAVYAWRLAHDAVPLLSESVRKFLLDVEVEAMRRAADIEDFGAPVDHEWVEGQIAAGTAMAAALRSDAISGFRQMAESRGRGREFPPDLNLNSTKQMRHVIFELCGMPVVSYTKGGKSGNRQPSTSKAVMETLAKRFGGAPQRLADFRRCENVVARLREFLDYGQAERGWWFLHGGQNPTGTATGRWSHSDPNLGNLTKDPLAFESGTARWEVKLRNAITAPPGWYLVTADYSQIELRVTTGESGCRAWWDAFNSDGDVHVATAAAVFGVAPERVTAEQRRMGKLLNFSMLYGAEAGNIAERLGIEKEAAQQLINSFWAGLPEVASWRDRVHASVRKQKYVETHFGRRRWLREIDDENAYVRLSALRESVNTIIQGTAADILKIGLARQVDVERQFGARCFLTIHDQFVWAVPEEVPPGEFARAAAARITFPVRGYPEIPVDFGVGRRFGSMVAYASAEDVPEALGDVSERERVLETVRLRLSVDRAISKAEAAALRDLVSAHPGENEVLLRVGQGEFALPSTSLGVSDAIRFRAAVDGLLVSLI